MNDIEKVNHWLTHQKRERGRSTTTLYSYSRDCIRFLDHLANHGVSLDTAGIEHLRGWVHTPVEKGSRIGQAPSQATVKRRVSMLRALFGFLHAEGFVNHNHAARLVAPQGSPVKPKPIDLNLWRELWASKKLSDDDRVALSLGLFCGLRRAEIVSVQVDHFQGDMLVGFPRKGNKLGQVPWLSCLRFFAEKDPTLVGGDVTSVLRPLERVRQDALTRRSSDGLLLPWRAARKNTCPTKFRTAALDPQHMNRHMEKALVEAGLPANAATPHQLRHGFCTFLLANGVELLSVSRLAGHASVEVTQRYIATAADPLAPLLGDVSGEVNVFGRIA